MELFFNSWWGNLILIIGAFMLLASISMLPGFFIRLAGRIIINFFWGGLFLAGINFFALWSGIALPLNGFTLGVAGVLGAPGMLALAVLASIAA